MKSMPNNQAGSMLLEALISILIFSIGILAIIGLQAASIKMSTDAKYRSEASLIANQYLATLWSNVASAVVATDGMGSPLAFSSTEFATYTTGGANFDNWFNTYVTSLPSASATVAASTTLTCGNAACPVNPIGVQQNTLTNVDIKIHWKLPGGDAHTYSTSALISAQKLL